MASPKDITVPGLYVIDRRHFVELAEGQVCSYPDIYTEEKFSDTAALQRKYPELPDQAQGGKP